MFFVLPVLYISLDFQPIYLLNFFEDTKNFVLPSWILKSINTSLAFSSLLIPSLLDLVVGNRGAAMTLLKKIVQSCLVLSE